MIGSQGSKIREVRDLFPEVQINFPDPSKKSDVVTLRGPKNEVDKCHKYMQQLNLELVGSCENINNNDDNDINNDNDDKIPS